MLKEVIVGAAICIAALFALLTLIFLVISLLPSPTTRRLLKRWQKRNVSAATYR